MLAADDAEEVREGWCHYAADGALATQPGSLPKVPGGQSLSGLLALGPISGRSGGQLALAFLEVAC